MKYLEFKKRAVRDAEVFAGDVTNGITEGFKLESDVTYLPSEWPMDSSTQVFYR